MRRDLQVEILVKGGEPEELSGKGIRLKTNGLGISGRALAGPKRGINFDHSKFLGGKLPNRYLRRAYP